MDELDSGSFLAECEKAANIGYEIANKQEKNLAKTLSDAKDNIRKTLNDFNSSKCYSPEAAELLGNQLLEIEEEFQRLAFVFSEDLEKLRLNLAKFSISLFGRTMAGKSTIMEILIKGNGESIGKGSQRTTRDVREYTWRGLHITDVPGIAAFEGEDDEQIAFDAAKKADLIFFLLTNDGPKAPEAECFSRIISLGKPVICIMNVKVSMYENSSFRIIKRDILKSFNLTELNSLREQFLQFAPQFGQSWNHIPFVYVNLQAAYKAMRADDPELKKELLQLSRFEYLEKQIMNQITTSGKFYRIKTFIDIISKPILDSIDTLLLQSQINSAQGRTILSKKRQLEAWKNTYFRDGKAEIDSLITNIKSDLYSEIAAFAEDHYSDKNADKAWNELLKERKIESSCQELLERLETKAHSKLMDVSSEITKELNFVTTFNYDRHLKMKHVIDTKKAWNWSSIIIGGGFSIAYGIAWLLGAAATGPLGWTALAINTIGIIGSRFFKKREKKEYEARTKLEKNLQANITKICNSLKLQMDNRFSSLVNGTINSLLREMDKVNSVVFDLADTQRKLAWGLNERLLELNNQILYEAMRMLDAEDIDETIQSVARIPGNTTLIMLHKGTIFPNELKDKLYHLMGERISFVKETENKLVLLYKVLGKEIGDKKISIEEKIGVAHVPLQEATPNMINRVQLAQQLTGLQIINQ